jgi:hypothetical protein
VLFGSCQEPPAPASTGERLGDLGTVRRGVVIAAAGDIACGGEPCEGQIGTARLIRRIDPRAVLTLGDNQYPDGEYADFLASYDPTWGAFLDITRPTPGNHDYHVEGAAGYFRYFGRRAHRRAGGYYSFNLGRWHLLALNSGPGSISDPTATSASSPTGTTPAGRRAPSTAPTRTWRRSGRSCTRRASMWC